MLTFAAVDAGRRSTCAKELFLLKHVYVSTRHDRYSEDSAYDHPLLESILYHVPIVFVFHCGV